MLHHAFMNCTFFPPDGSLLQKHDAEYSIKDPLQYEGTRLSTFATFPNIHGVYTTRLAGAGFYYAGKGDEVVCFSCNISYKNWKQHDSPKEVHRRFSPHCNFIQNTSSKLIPHAITENTVSRGSCGSTFDAIESDKTLTRVSQTNLSSINSNTRESNRQSFPQIITNDISTASKARLEPMTLGICVDKPKYPKYSIRSTRLNSFQHWPTYLTQSPDEMASAGFFFTGTGDHCRCFFCGEGLRNWEPGDEPWVEHARWYSSCAFVRNCKGDRFIDDIQTNNYMQTEKVKKNVVPYPERQSNDFTNIPAVQSAKEFGYDEKLIKEAYNTLQQSGESDITGSALLEAIFFLEECSNSNQPEAEDMAKPVMEKRVNKEKADQELELSNRILKEEIQNLKDHQTCKICLDEQIEIVFLPCSHLAACVSCAPNLRRCPICRTKIKRRVKAIIC